MELTRLWCEAATQLINCEVDWRVAFPQHGASVWALDNAMHVQWGNLTIDGRADARSFGASGVVGDLAGWDRTSQKEPEHTTTSGQ